jgi:hypothetical protein
MACGRYSNTCTNMFRRMNAIIPNIVYIFTIIRKLWLKISRVRRLISLIRVFKVLTTIIFTYQSILLTIDYLKYETVIDLKLNKELNDYMPAISLCFRTKLLKSDFENSTTKRILAKLLCRIPFKGMIN